jgi:hypothetical protein
MQKSNSSNAPFWLRVAVCCAMAMVCAPWLTAQQQNCTSFGNPSAYSGTFTMNGSGGGTIGDTEWTINESISGTFIFDTRGPFGIGYAGTASVTTGIHDRTVLTQSDGSLFTTEYSTTAPYEDMYSTLNLDLLTCNYEIVVNHTNPNGQQVATNDTGSYTSTQGFSWGPASDGSIALTATGDPANVLVALPLTGPNITYTKSFQDNSGFLGYGPVNWTVSWTLKPGLPSDKLVVKISDYTGWRPTGGMTETDIGKTPKGVTNYLHIAAELQNADGTPSTDIPDSVKFSLVNYSSEPGVTLNWPAKNSAKSTPDMEFSVNTSTPGALVPTLSNNNLVATFTPTAQNPQTAYLIDVAPHDWGGWATLNVTATISGLEIQGHLQLQPSQVASNPGEANQGAVDIPLPDRQPNSHIADNWKNHYGIALGTTDDDDKEMSEGQNQFPGDGLTLYEEYRGFYVGCSRATPTSGCRGNMVRGEGDPTKKDLFVVNQSGRSRVAGGIKLFQRITGVNVTFKSMSMDLIGTDRVINFNFVQGAHEVNQHALVITTGPASADFGCANGGPGNPQYVNKIYIPPDSLFTGTVSPDGGTQPAIDIGNLQAVVAHEIGHGVGIWHHGELDETGTTGPYVYWYTPDGFVLKEIGKVANDSFAQSLELVGSGTPIRVFNEDGQDVTLVFIQDAAAEGLQKNWQGVDAGQHSGDVKCVMKYFMSTNYISKADRSVRYWAEEYAGDGMTDTGTGTDTNDPNRKTPQSRYSSAAAPRGQCLSQLCVNDALTPQTFGSRGTCGFPQ